MEKGLLSPISWADNGKDIVYELHLEHLIGFISRSQRRGGVDLDQPGFTVVIDEYIVPIHLKTVLIVNNNVLH